MQINRILTVLALILGIVVIVATQFYIPTLFCVDSYYHIRIADIIRNSGLIYNFHWARFATDSTHFADKAILYHLMIVPFTLWGNNLIFAGKLASVFFAILFLVVFFIVLRKYSAPVLIPVFIVGLFLSDIFLCALSLLRPMVFAFALSLLAVYFLIERKPWGVFITTFIYCLSHISGPIILFYALIVEIVRLFNQKKFYSESIAVVLSAIITSYLIHPNFPNNVLVFYLNAILVPVYAIRGVIDHGDELNPLTTRQFFASFPLIMLGLLLLLGIAIFARPRTKFATQVLFVCSGFSLIFAFFNQRFAVHGYPFILLFVSSYISDYLQDKPDLPAARRNKILTTTSLAILCIVFAFFAQSTFKKITAAASYFGKRNSHYEQVGRWMSEHIPKGELIYHTCWSESEFFFGLNPNNDYFVMLHPIYMYWATPELYTLYHNISYGRTKEPYYLLRDVFKAKYGYARKGYGLVSQIKEDARFKILYEDEWGLVFELN